METVLPREIGAPLGHPVSSETVGGATYQNPFTTTKKHDLRLKTTARKN